MANPRGNVINMDNLISESRNVNIRYDLPVNIWDKVPDVYKSMEGWLGFGDGKFGEKGISESSFRRQQRSHLTIAPCCRTASRIDLNPARKLS